MTPLLPRGDIFHSSFRSKLSKSSSVTISPPFAVCQSFFEDVSRVMAPSATFQAGPTGPPPYLCQPFVLCPSNRVCHPSEFVPLATLVAEESWERSVSP